MVEHARWDGFESDPESRKILSLLYLAVQTDPPKIGEVKTIIFTWEATQKVTFLANNGSLRLMLRHHLLQTRFTGKHWTFHITQPATIGDDDE